MRKKKQVNQKIRSDCKPKKKIIKKARVKFTFITLLGIKLDNSNSRLKIMGDGGVSCLIKDSENKWKSVKGDLKSIKIVMERIYVK